MAHVEKRGPGRWRARYYGPDGKERSKTFSRRVEAEQFLAEKSVEMRTGTYVDPQDARTTLRDYAEAWRAAQVHRASTADVTESNLRRHIYPTFGHRGLSTIRPTEVQGWVKLLTDELAPSTVASCYRLLSTVYKAAMADRMVTSTPCVGVRLPKQPKVRIVPLAVPAVRALQEAMPDRARGTVAVAAGAGLRQGEVLGLSVDRVNFLRRELTVDRQLVTPKKGVPVLGPPKTAASYRTIPLPRTVVDALAAHIASYPLRELEVFNSITQRVERVELLFTNTAGEPWRRNRFAEIWRNAARRTEVPEADFHDLRHHHASLLIAAGCSVKVVQAQLGHANASETLDTYSHLWPEDDDRVRDAVDRAFELDTIDQEGQAHG